MKKLALTCIVLMMLLATGCIKKYDLTVQESDSIAEYMAGLLLSYDKNYDSSLKIMNEVEQNKDNVKNKGDKEGFTQTSITNSNINANANSNEVKSSDITLSEAIGAKKFKIEYTGYKLYDTYPEDASTTYFSLTPGEGNQLLVLSFSAKNTDKKDKQLNLTKSKVRYQLDINGKTKYKPLLTLLENDLQYIDTSFKGGESKTVLLVYEIPKKIDVSYINLIVSKDNSTKIIDIK